MPRALSSAGRGQVQRRKAGLVPGLREDVRVPTRADRPDAPKPAWCAAWRWTMVRSSHGVQEGERRRRSTTAIAAEWSSVMGTSRLKPCAGDGRTGLPLGCRGPALTQSPSVGTQTSRWLRSLLAPAD